MLRCYGCAATDACPKGCESPDTTARSWKTDQLPADFDHAVETSGANPMSWRFEGKSRPDVTEHTRPQSSWAERASA